MLFRLRSILCCPLLGLIIIEEELMVYHHMGYGGGDLIVVVSVESERYPTGYDDLSIYVSKF